MASWRFSVRNRAVFSCARPMNSTPSVPVKSARCSCITSSLRCPLAKSTQGTPLTRAKRCTAVLNASVIFASGAVEAIGNPNCRWT